MKKTLHFALFLVSVLLSSTLCAQEISVADSVKKHTESITRAEMDRYHLRDIRSLVKMKTSWYQFGDQIVNNGLFSGNDCFSIDGMYVREIDNFPLTSISAFSLNPYYSSLEHGYSAARGFSMVTPIEKDTKFTIDYLGNVPFMAVDGGKTVFNKTAIGYFESSLTMASTLNKIGKGKNHPSVFLSGSVKYGKDAGTSFVPKMKMNGDLQQELQQSAVRPTENGFGGYYDNVKFVKNDELTSSPYSENSKQKQLNLYGKINLPVNDKLSIDLVSLYSNNKGKQDIFQNRLFNHMNNPDFHKSYFDGMVALNHKIINKESFKLDYRLSIGYDNAQSKTGTDAWDKDFFKYAYSGSFTENKERSFEFGNFNGISAWYMNGYYDRTVDFKPGTFNPGLSNYIYDVFSTSAINDADYELFYNGYLPGRSYGLWNNYDVPVTAYSETQSQRMSIKGAVNSEVGKNKLQLGFEYRDDLWRSFTMDAAQLWIKVRNLTNEQILQIDKDNPIYIYQNGIFQDTVIYNRFYNEADQSEFDRNLRLKLGLPVNGHEYILINSYDFDNNTIKYYDDQNQLQTVNVPEGFLNIDMLSSDELKGISNGIGYDSYGNKVNRKHNAFSYQEDGAQTPYAPSNLAAWLSYKRDFGKLSINGGLRIERFDARQPVLADPLSFYRISTVAETPEFLHPANIPDDYLVYQDLYNTKAVGAYRQGEQWYNPDGTIMNSVPAFLYSDIKPVYFEQSHSGVVDMYFEDYKPVVSLLPLLNVSYEINNSIAIGINYASSTRNPYYNYFDGQSYESLWFGTNNLINNSALQPERFDNFTAVINYFGNKGLSVSFNSRLMIYSDAIEEYYINNAYPNSYFTYANREKSISLPSAGLQVQYSKPGSWWELGANYTHNFFKKVNTLQDINSDYTTSLFFLSSSDVLNANGAIIFRKKLEGLTLGATWSQRSGTPYMGSSNVNSLFNNEIKRMKGARNLDLKINYRINLRSKNEAVECFLMISNILNYKTVYQVYGNTGKADDNGYLTDPANQIIIYTQLDPQAFRDQYTLRMNSPFSYAPPRSYWLGFRFMF